MVNREFLVAGKAIFTVSNPMGERYTFQITKKEAKGSYPDSWFVALLTGPNNESDYTYLGMLIPTQGEVRLTKASKYTSDTKPVRVIQWLVKQLWNEKELPEGYKVQHEGKCARCGRMLTVPESIESGFGPECAKRRPVTSGFISEGELDPIGLTPIYDEEYEITCWKGFKDGQFVTIFND